MNSRIFVSFLASLALAAGIYAQPAQLKPPQEATSAPIAQGLKIQGKPADPGWLMSTAHRHASKARQLLDQGNVAGASEHHSIIMNLPWPEVKTAKMRRYLGTVGCNWVMLLKRQEKWKEAAGAAEKGLKMIDIEGEPATYHVYLMHSLRSQIYNHLGETDKAKAADALAAKLEGQLQAGP